MESRRDGETPLCYNDCMKLIVVRLCVAVSLFAALSLVAQDGVFCRYCGGGASTVRSLVGMSCPRHPDGPGRGKHALYEGVVGERYLCVNCGLGQSSLRGLLSTSCPRHPEGAGKGKHVAYEGGVKTSYTCKRCGTSMSTLYGLVTTSCPKHPAGPGRGKHTPAR